MRRYYTAFDMFTRLNLPLVGFPQLGLKSPTWTLISIRHFLKGLPTCNAASTITHGQRNAQKQPQSLARHRCAQRFQKFRSLQRVDDGRVPVLFSLFLFLFNFFGKFEFDEKNKQTKK